jgi:hypothetical protein
VSVHWVYVDQARLIPVDVSAEEAAAGIAVASGDEAIKVVTATTAACFHDPRLWDIVAAAAELPGDIIDGRDEWTTAAAVGDHRLVVMGCEARATAIAVATGIEVALLVQLVEHRPSPVIGKQVLERLVAADHARATRAHLVAELEALGVDVVHLVDADGRTAALQDALLRTATGLGGVLADTGPDTDAIDALTDAGRLVGLTRDEIAVAVLAATTVEETPS